MSFRAATLTSGLVQSADLRYVRAWQYRRLNLQGARQGQACIAQGYILADCINTNGSAMCYVGNTTMERCMPGDYEAGSAMLGERSLISCKAGSAALWPEISYSAPFLCVGCWVAGLHDDFEGTVSKIPASCV